MLVLNALMSYNSLFHLYTATPNASQRQPLYTLINVFLLSKEVPVNESVTIERRQSKRINITLFVTQSKTLLLYKI